MVYHLIIFFYLQNPLKVIARKETPMKRNQEVSIIIQSLLENGLLQERQTDRARSVVKEAFKEIRRVRYEERQEKGGDMLDIKKSNSIVEKQLRKILLEKGIKQVVFANKSGFTAQELSDMLNGRRLIRVVDMIAILNALQEYQVDANEFFGIENQNHGISVKGEKVKEIQILTVCNELIASITDENVIEKTGYKVVCVPDTD